MRGKRPGKVKDEPKARPEYIAAIRYKDGSKDLYYVRNANDLEDARDVVMNDQMNVKIILLALRRPKPESK
jgi:hypothetical protein